MSPARLAFLLVLAHSGPASAFQDAGAPADPVLSLLDWESRVSEDFGDPSLGWKSYTTFSDNNPGTHPGRNDPPTQSDQNKVKEDTPIAHDSKGEVKATSWATPTGFLLRVKGKANGSFINGIELDTADDGDPSNPKDDWASANTTFTRIYERAAGAGGVELGQAAVLGRVTFQGGELSANGYGDATVEFRSTQEFYSSVTEPSFLFYTEEGCIEKEGEELLGEVTVKINKAGAVLKPINSALEDLPITINKDGSVTKKIDPHEDFTWGKQCTNMVTVRTTNTVKGKGSIAISGVAIWPPQSLLVPNSLSGSISCEIGGLEQITVVLGGCGDSGRGWNPPGTPGGPGAPHPGSSSPGSPRTGNPPSVPPVPRAPQTGGPAATPSSAPSSSS